MTSNISDLVGSNLSWNPLARSGGGQFNAKSLQQYGGLRNWVPVGFRGLGLPGSGGAYDPTNTSVNDALIMQAPSFSAITALRLVYGGFDFSDHGPLDRAATVTGSAVVYLPTAGGMLGFLSAAASSGATTLSITIGQGLGSNGLTAGMACSAAGIPSNTYVTAVTPTFDPGTGNLTGLNVSLNNALTAGIASGATINFLGQFYPVKWGQSATLTISPMHDFYLSDPIPVQIAAGAQFVVRGNWNFSTAGISLASSPAAASGAARLTFGGLLEGSSRGVGLSSLNLTPYSTSNTGGGWWPPVTCMGLLAAPAAAVLILGDSIAAGTGDLIDANGRMGFIQRTLSNTVPWASLARGSTSAAQLASNPRGAYRLSIETGTTDVILEYCRNDLASGGSTATQIVAELQAIAAPYLATGKRVWICTALPTTSSTNGWTSDAGQSLVYSAPETQRQTYNANVRANATSLGFTGLIDIALVVESATAPGKWRSDGGAWTADGIHPNSTLGHPGLIAAGVVPTAQFIL